MWVTFLVIFALFLANETTVQVARVALPRVLPAQWLNLPKKVQKAREKWQKTPPKFYYNLVMITVSCVGYFLEFVGRLRIKSSENVHFGLIFPFLEHCEVVEKFYLSTYKPLFNLAYWNLTWKRLVCFLEMTVNAFAKKIF